MPAKPEKSSRKQITLLNCNPSLQSMQKMYKINQTEKKPETWTWILIQQVNAMGKKLFISSN